MLRSLVAWGPVLVAVALMIISIWLGPSRAVLNGVIGLIGLVTLAVGAICSVLAPRFSWHDRIARTVVVPL